MENMETSDNDIQINKTEHQRYLEENCEVALDTSRETEAVGLREESVLEQQRAEEEGLDLHCGERAYETTNFTACIRTGQFKELTFGDRIVASNSELLNECNNIRKPTNEENILNDQKQSVISDSSLHHKAEVPEEVELDDRSKICKLSSNQNVDHEQLNEVSQSANDVTMESNRQPCIRPNEVIEESVSTEIKNVFTDNSGESRNQDLVKSSQFPANDLNNVERTLPGSTSGKPPQTTTASNPGKVKKARKQQVGENQERMNYLIQASRYLNNVDEDADRCRTISASLGSLSMAIGRKCVIRMTPTLKRQLCKGCGSCLIPGVSARCRLRSNRQKHLVVTCNKCKTIKRFVTHPDHELWCENPEAFVS